MSTLVHLTTVFGLANGKKATINLDFETPSAVDATDLENGAQAAYDGWTGSPSLQDSFGSDMNMSHAEAYAFDIEADTGPGEHPPFKRTLTLGPYTSAGSPVNGTGTVSLPPQNAVVATFRTALAGRSGRGRVYLPPVPEANVDGAGTIGSSPLAALETAFNDWVEGIEDALSVATSGDHVVVSLTTGDFNVVTTRLIRSRIDTQRRRLTRETT